MSLDARVRIWLHDLARIHEREAGKASNDTIKRMHQKDAKEIREYLAKDTKRSSEEINKLLDELDTLVRRVSR